MKKKIKIIIVFIIIIIVIVKLAFKYGIKIEPYNTMGFIVTVSNIRTDENFKQWLEYEKLKDFENMKKLDYECTKFFDFSDEDIICEYVHINTTVIYEGPAQKRNIYAALCKDKKIKYIVDAIGTVESIEDRYNYEEPKKNSWLSCTYERETQDLELTNAQYNKIINLLKFLKLCHTKNKEYNLWEKTVEDRNVFYMEGYYYNFEDDDRFISTMIENELENYLRGIIYEDSGFDWWDFKDK